MGLRSGTSGFRQVDAFLDSASSTIAARAPMTRLGLQFVHPTSRQQVAIEMGNDFSIVWSLPSANYLNHPTS